MSINNISNDIVEKIYEPMIVGELEKNKLLNKIKSDAVTYSKAKMLIEQMCLLKNQLQQVIDEGLLNNNLYEIECKFEKVSGNTYHLYKDGERYYFSMLSDDDWNGNSPHTYICSYFFDYDKCFRLKN